MSAIADFTQTEGGYQSHPDNEWRIEYHGDESNEWTVWRWDYPTDEWVPVAISVAAGYPLPETVIRSQGFSDLKVAQAWVGSRIAVGAALSAVSAILAEASDELAGLDLLAVGGGDGTTEFADAYREWRRATSRLIAVADHGTEEGRLS